MGATENSTPPIRQVATKEFGLLVFFLFAGLVLLPVLIYFVGQSVFGDYEGVGYGDFFSGLSEKIRNGDWASWFLILSPYFAWQCLRLMAYGWRLAGRST